MSSSSIKVFSDINELSHFAAQLFSTIAAQAIANRKRFIVSLAGGGTPITLYRLLASSPYSQSLSWEKILFFWGDERCVSLDDVENSYHQAYQALLGKVPIPEDNIFRVKAELTPAAAAIDYASQLQTLAENGMRWPRFDLVVLGLGEDGHTASLFPGSDETNGVASMAVTANYQGRPASRVSLSSNVFNSARTVMFLVTGAQKAVALAATLAGVREPDNLPAQRIMPIDGNIIWLVDVAAARLLPSVIDGLIIQR